MSLTNASPLTSLVGLPQELQDLIIPYLDDTSPCWTKIPNLLSLSRTCKTLRATCMQTIFEDLNLSARSLTRGAIEDTHFCPRRIIALTRACDSSPSDLAFHIRTIRVDNLDASDRTLEQLLPYTRCLTSLSINYEIVHYEDREAMRISITHLAKSFRVLGSSLTQLVITYSYTTAITSGFSLSRPPADPHIICSWIHLIALEQLDIPPSVLLGWRVESRPPLVDVLPQSLVQLHLGKDVWWQFQDNPVHEVIFDLVEHENWRNITPSLKNVSCHLRSGGSLENLQARRKALRDLLEQNGLHYKEDIRRIVKETGGLKMMERRDLLEAEGIDLDSATKDVRALYGFRPGVLA